MESLQLAFDYQQLDTVTGINLKQRAGRINERTRRMAQDIWENGRDFYEAQQELAKYGYGCFQQWVEAETGYSHQTAYRFIRVYLKLDYNNLLQSNWGASALYLLTSPDTPNEALAEAITRAQNGETITHSAAKEIINDHKGIEWLNNPATWHRSNSYTGPLFANDPELNAALADESKSVCQECGQVYDGPSCPDCHPQNGKPHVAFNAGDNEWYTPLEYIEAARAVMGDLDLDPASSEIANAIIKAKTFYNAESDGLSKAWTGKVWMNPPYARDLIYKFCNRLTEYFQAGDVQEAIVLINNATETKWFQSLACCASALCLPEGRVQFWHPEKVATPLQGQAILYLGNRPDLFISEFRKFGAVWQST